MQAKGVGCVLAIAALAATMRAQLRPDPDQQQQPQAPVFRSTISLVPVDVRVTDKDGKPVTDLTQEDFTILEDGKRQEVRHFTVQRFTPRRQAPGDGLALRENAISFEPQTSRIFLIVLGRGRLQEPSKAVDAVIGFVREELLPQDQVAVFAYNRATAFTADHRRIAALLEQFRLSHERVDFAINELQLRGVAAIYGSKGVPGSVQQEIDRMFEASAQAASVEREPGAAAASRIVEDARRQGSAQVQQEQELAGRALTSVAGSGARTGYITSWGAFDEVQTGMFADLSLDNFVSATAQTLEDLGNLYAAIEYLRRFQGEKHLVYLTERGLTLSRLEEDERLAAAASDARVAIDTVETGGIYVGQAGAKAAEGRWNQTFAFRTLRTIAELTGGVSSIGESGTTAFARLNAAASASYLLGYYPTNANWDGAYRKVVVKVSRPDVNVYYRHGYYGRKDVPAFNRRDFITAGRIRAASTFPREIKDIRLTLDASLARTDDDKGYEMNVNLGIDPTKLAFRSVDGVQIGRASIAVFCFNEKEDIIASSIQHAELKLSPTAFQKALGSGVPYKVRFPTAPSVRRVRAVVYDYEADLVGSTDRLMR